MNEQHDLVTEILALLARGDVEEVTFRRDLVRGDGLGIVVRGKDPDGQRKGVMHELPRAQLEQAVVGRGEYVAGNLAFMHREFDRP